MTNPTQMAETAQAGFTAGFTPGPWLQGWYRLGNGDQGFDIYGADSRTIARIPVIGDTRDLQQAHANLITAAPELYECAAKSLAALRQLIPFLKDAQFGLHAGRLMVEISRVEQALAKAEGRP